MLFPLSKAVALVSLIGVSYLHAVGAMDHSGRSRSGLIGYGINMYDPYCATACQRFIAPSPLTCSHVMEMDGMAMAETSPECYATNDDFLKTLAWCWQQRCNDTDIWLLEQYWQTDAVGVAPVTMQPSPKWTYQGTLRQIDQPPTIEMVSSEPLNVTSLVSYEDWDAQYRTLCLFQQMETNHSRYGIVLVITCALIPIALSWLRFIPFPEALVSRFNAVFVNPPLLGSRHKVPYMNLAVMPTRGQSFFISYLVIINIVLCAVGYHSTQPNLWFASLNGEMLAYISNRTGVLSLANIPVLILYAGRNNILLWLTDWSQSTFLLMHRWVAYLCTLQAVFHSIGYLRIYTVSKTHSSESQLPYWYWGIIATLGFCIILPASIIPIRQKMYELFLASHFALSLITLVGCYLHIYYRFQHQWGYEVWVYAGFAFWAFDRVARVLRLAMYGLRWATVEVLDDEYLKIKIAGVTANGHAYLYFPTLSWKVWENHPFSVAASSEPHTSANSEIASPSSSLKGIEAGMPVAEKETAAATTTPAHLSPAKQRSVGLTFFLQTHSGTTSLLRACKRVPVLLETGYAPTHDLSKYEDVVCIAGGVGITAVIPILRANRERARLYWSSRSDALVDGGEPMFDGVEKNVVVGRRHDVNAVVEQEVSCGEGPIAFVVSGPAGMADDARAAVTAVMRKGGRPVNLIEESFSW